ncbi:ABC transporter ATP-binding protein, partial [Alphaproteobacteria bacterium]|nr:ABC transporter ATP-binding protein [Alphaproteobacteria bacterium]
AQPTWGVDVGAAVSVRTAMLDLAANGSAVIMISQDLEIAVLHDGRLSDVMPADQVTAEQIGLLMGGDDARRGASR